MLKNKNKIISNDNKADEKFREKKEFLKMQLNLLILNQIILYQEVKLI